MKPAFGLVGLLALSCIGCANAVTDAGGCAAVKSVGGGGTDGMGNIQATALHGGFVSFGTASAYAEEEGKGRTCTAILQWVRVDGKSVPGLWTAQHCFSPGFDATARLDLFDPKTSRHVAFPFTFSGGEQTARLREALAPLPHAVSLRLLRLLGVGFDRGTQEIVDKCRTLTSSLGALEGMNVNCSAFMDMALLLPTFPAQLSSAQGELLERLQTEQAQARSQTSLLLGIAANDVSQKQLTAVLAAVESMPQVAQGLTALRLEQGILRVREALEGCLADSSTTAFCLQRESLLGAMSSVYEDKLKVPLADFRDDWKARMDGTRALAHERWDTIAQSFGPISTFVMASTHVPREAASAFVSESVLQGSSASEFFINMFVKDAFPGGNLGRVDADRYLRTDTAGNVAFAFPVDTKTFRPGDSGTFFSVGSLLTLGVLSTVNGEPVSGGIQLRADVVDSMPDAPDDAPPAPSAGSGAGPVAARQVKAPGQCK